DQLDLPAGRLAARALDAHLEAVEHVLAGLGEDAGERAHEPDLDRLGGGRGRSYEHEQKRDGAVDHGGIVLSPAEGATMKITVPVLMKDPAVVQYKDLELVRNFDVGHEEFLRRTTASPTARRTRSCATAAR